MTNTDRRSWPTVIKNKHTNHFGGHILMINAQLAELLKQHIKDDLVCVRIAGSDKRLKIVDVDDGCDVGMLEVVVEPFDSNDNYYAETNKQAENWNRYTVIDKSMVGKTYSVYNGVGFVPITPNSENIGKRLIDLAMRV